jgi:hypothetical protein
MVLPDQRTRGQTAQARRCSMATTGCPTPRRWSWHLTKTEQPCATSLRARLVPCVSLYDNLRFRPVVASRPAGSAEGIENSRPPVRDRRYRSGNHTDSRRGGPSRPFRFCFICGSTVKVLPYQDNTGTTGVSCSARVPTGAARRSRNAGSRLQLKTSRRSAGPSLPPLPLRCPCRFLLTSSHATQPSRIL